MLLLSDTPFIRSSLGEYDNRFKQNCLLDVDISEPQGLGQGDGLFLYPSVPGWRGWLPLLQDFSDFFQTAEILF